LKGGDAIDPLKKLGRWQSGIDRQAAERNNKAQALGRRIKTYAQMPTRLRSKPPVAFCRIVRQILRIELQAKLGAYMSVTERG